MKGGTPGLIADPHQALGPRLRTSSKTNVGPDKDSDKRQLAAITRYAKSAGYEIGKKSKRRAIVSARETLRRAGYRLAELWGMIHV